MFIGFVYFDWLFFCVILTLVCSLRACHMWLTRNNMFIHETLGKVTSFNFWNFPPKHVITSTKIFHRKAIARKKKCFSNKVCWFSKVRAWKKYSYLEFILLINCETKIAQTYIQVQNLIRNLPFNTVWIVKSIKRF